MKTTIEEEGKEGDEPKRKEFDEEKENCEWKKKMKKGKEVGVPRVGASQHEQTPQGDRRPCCAGRDLDKVEDMPVVCNDRGLSSSESASDSVHRRILWTFQIATETGTHSANCAAGSLVRRMAVDRAFVPVSTKAPGPQQPLQAQALSFCAFSRVGLDVPVFMLVCFGVVAVLRHGTLRSCCSLDFWTLFLSPLLTVLLAEVKRQSWRLSDDFTIFSVDAMWCNFWFDSGYIFFISLWMALEEFHIFYVVW